MIPGNTTITGIINFKKAANTIPFCPSARLFAANVL
jgi:molybdenum cofactor biosynthesis enzyme